MQNGYNPKFLLIQYVIGEIKFIYLKKLYENLLYDWE